MHDEIAHLASAVDAFSASPAYAGYLACLYDGQTPDVAALLATPTPVGETAAREGSLYAYACAVATRHGLAVRPNDLLAPYQSGRVINETVVVSAHAPYLVLLDAVLGAVAARWLVQQGLAVDAARLETYAAIAAHLTLAASGLTETLTARELALRGVTGLLVRAAAPCSAATATYLLHALHEVSAGRVGRVPAVRSHALPRPLGPGVEDALWASLQTCDHLHIVLAAEPRSPGDEVIQHAADEVHAAFAGALDRVAAGSAEA